MRRLKSTISSPFPDGWFFKEQITLLAPDGKANIIASSEPLDPAMDLGRYVDEQSKPLQNLPGFREFSLESMTVFGRYEGKLRAFGWSPPDEEPSGPVSQLQLYCVVGGRGYTATATTPTTEFERYRPQLVQVLVGLLIE